MKYTNIEYLSKDEYFGYALRVTEKMGLHKLMVIKQDYCPRLIQQFFATLEFDTQEYIGFTWMTGEVRRSSTFTRFGKPLGYNFYGIHSPRGHRMHLDTSEYNKKKIQSLYMPGGKARDTANFSHFMIFCSACSVPTSLQVVATMIPFEVVLCIFPTMPA
jgi:hypothetical protein